jgi:hypothetical protein
MRPARPPGSDAQFSKLLNSGLFTRQVQSLSRAIELEKVLGQTGIVGQGMLDQPPWHWPD